MNIFLKIFVKIMVLISSILPRPILRKMGSWVGFLWFDVFGFRKDVIFSNLDIAFPNMPSYEKYKIGRESVYQLGYNFSEFFVIPSLDQKWIDKNAVVHGWENVQTAQAQGKGIFFLTLHVGNGDLGANVVVMKGQPLKIITKVFKTKWFNDLWFSVRGAKGVQYIDAHSPNNAFEILKALKKNEGVVFVLDQYMGPPYGIKTKFFGKDTGTAYGLALFVQKSKAPVLPIYTYQGPDGKIHIVIEPPVDIQDCLGEDKDETILNLTQRFCEKTEEIIRKHPEQWMWVHRRWKEFR